MAARNRAWCFTINNPTDADRSAVAGVYNSGAAVYIVYGDEQGESGTPHIQGYVRFKSPKALAAVQRILGGRAHLEVGRGNDQQNRDYIIGPYTSPDGSKTKPFNELAVEFGEMQIGQGKRTDLDKVRDLVTSGANIKSIIMEASSLQSIKTAQVIMPYLEDKRMWKTKVNWLWGPTGTGKSHTAWSEAGPEAYAPLSYKWWQGYDRHAHVVLDDIRPGWATFDEFLRLFDKYPLTVEYKGGSRQFQAKEIWVTAPMPPLQFFEGVNGEAMNQIIRRIEVVRHLAVKHVDPPPQIEAPAEVIVQIDTPDIEDIV